MKILHLIHSLDLKKGGVATSVRFLSGHNTILTLDAPSSSSFNDIETDVIALGPSYFKFGFTTRLIPWLNENLNRFDAAVVHGLWQYHGLGLFLAKKPPNFPIYIFPHGMLDDWFQKAYPLKHLKKLIYWYFISSHLFKTSRRIFFTSEMEKARSQRFLKYYKGEQTVLTYGIHPPSFDESTSIDAFLSKHPQFKNKQILLYLSRVHPKKGVHFILKAWQELYSKKAIPLNWVLLIVGPHDKEDETYYEKLICLAKKCGESVSFIPYLSGKEKWGALYFSTFFILPSHQENFGIAVVEAMAAKTPVLISTEVNIAPTIMETSSGFVSHDSYEGTLKMIEKALRCSPEDISVLRKNALNAFNEHFNLNNIDNTLEHILKEDYERNQMLAHPSLSS